MRKDRLKFMIAAVAGLVTLVIALAALCRYVPALAKTIGGDGRDLYISDISDNKNDANSEIPGSAGSNLSNSPDGGNISDGPGIENPDIIDRPPAELELSIPPVFKHYYDKNKDLVGYLEIPGVLSEPVVKGENNEKYLTTRLDGSYAPYPETIFMDSSCEPENPRAQDMIIYGHNLLSGKGFSPLARYYPYLGSRSGDLSFCRANAVIKYQSFFAGPDTPDNAENSVSYKIFAVACIPADPEDKYFMDIADHDKFRSDNSFYDHISDIFDRSLVNFNTSVARSDKILTLITCMDILGKNHEIRLAIFARALREGESPDDIDINNISLAESPKYPKIYYDILGGDWSIESRKWDAGLILR